MILLTIDEMPLEKEQEIARIAEKKVYLLGRDEVPYEEIDTMITYGFEVTPEYLDKMPNLRWIQVFQTGIEHIPLDEVEKRGIVLTNVRGIYGTGMSEYVMSLILYEVRQIERFVQDKRNRRYDRRELVDEAYQKTIGIFGTGVIGQEVARKAQAFDMNVLGYNTSGRPVEYFDQTYSGTQKHEMLERCDFIVLLLPLIDETYHFMNEEAFQHVKEDAYLINIGRGPLIDETALLQALDENRLKGAALDVFYEEPLPQTSALWDAEKILITPHLSGKTQYFFDRSIAIFKENCQAFKGEIPYKYQIDFERGY